MKKTFKKLFAALLAAALVLAMAVPAFAVTNATKGSIKIDGTVSGETYTIYKLFNLDRSCLTWTATTLKAIPIPTP